MIKAVSTYAAGRLIKIGQIWLYICLSVSRQPQSFWMRCVTWQLSLWQLWTLQSTSSCWSCWGKARTGRSCWPCTGKEARTTTNSRSCREPNLKTSITLLSPRIPQVLPWLWSSSLASPPHFSPSWGNTTSLCHSAHIRLWLELWESPTSLPRTTSSLSRPASSGICTTSSFLRY